MCWHHGGTIMGRKYGIKGLYDKRGWFYYQPPTPKDGSGVQPNAIALGTKDLVEALTTLEEKRLELLQWQAARRRTLEEILPGYYSAKRKDAVLTRRQRKIVLDGFCRYLGNPRIEAITQHMVEEWREHVEMHGVKDAQTATKHAKKKTSAKETARRSPSTVKTYTIVVKAFFNWAVEHGHLKESPMRRMKRQVKVGKTKRQEFLTELEREKTLAAEAPDHIRFILFFGFFAGLRDGEMLAMTDRWLWIAEDWSRGTVTVQEQEITLTDGTKTVWKPKVRELRTIPLHPRLLAFLKDYTLRKPWMLRPDKEFWPVETKQSKRYDAHKALGNLAVKLGIPKLNYHILRHSFATHLVMKGASLAEVAGLLGDTLKVTEDNYAGYSPSRANPLSVL